MNEGWLNVELKDVLSEKGYVRGPFGSALKRAEMKNKGIPVYEQQNAIYNHRKFRYFIDDNKYQKLKRFTVRPNDLIISCSGTVGKVSIIKDADPPGIISQALLILRPDVTKILPEFLFYFFSSNAGHDSLVSVSSGSVQVNLAKRRVIESIRFILPPLDEQHKIVSQLAGIDQKIQLNTQLNQTLEVMAHVLFKSWFIDFDPVIDNAISANNPIPKPFQAKAQRRKALLNQTMNTNANSLHSLPAELKQLFPDTFKQAEGLGWIPDGFISGSLGTITTQKRKKVKDRDVEAIVLSAVAKGELVRSEDHFTKQVYSKNIDNYLVVEKWDVAYNPSRINIGSIGLQKEQILGAVSPVYVVAKVDEDYKWFIEQFFKLNTFKNWVDTLASGSVRQSLTYKDFSSIPCVVPMREIVLVFNKYFENIRAKLLHNDLENLSLAEIRDSLLPKLLSGQLLIPDVEAQLAETDA
ncbi:MAG: hypothetical protein CMP91_03630 [Gammaproteobacteria bacterium]|nr:hypothetical protein [Gammaproteobacteria bacterium]|tara:strand:- start:190127 stop:191527 length:1401 start_codon:yes stop_codon:yes gene_type:complete